MLYTKPHPHVTLVGAGPGDPELLTLKGLRALQTADVVLYDALVDEALLAHVPPDAPRIYVGKRAALHHRTQDQINRLLTRKAYEYGHAVRLKGGDPYVFGRGHEELAYAQDVGLPVSVVPGVSSCISVPALAGVPVTRRGVSESFWVMTATTRDGSLSRDLYDAARARATAVILMGVGRLWEIAQVFAKAGKGKTPAMVIQSGSTSDERVVVGTVADIAERARVAEIGTPGIIVFGEVVDLSPAAVRREVMGRALNDWASEDWALEDWASELDPKGPAIGPQAVPTDLRPAA